MGDHGWITYRAPRQLRIQLALVPRDTVVGMAELIRERPAGAPLLRLLVHVGHRIRLSSGVHQTGSSPSLNEKVEELRKAPITGPIPYLFLDATFLDARWARKVENVSALVAYGIGLDGHRQLLAVTVGAEESEDSWSELLAQLVERGLSGVQLVVADAHAGLAKAVRHHLPEAPLQRCTVHLLRNVLAKAPQRLRARLAREVSKVFDAPSKAEARRRVEALKAGLGKQVPEALACLENGFEAATHFYAFPREHWHRIRSTNGLERLHGEVKRRTRAVGAFPDRASALRLVTAVALQATAIWTDRRYLDMSLLKPKEDNAKAA